LVASATVLRIGNDLFQRLGFQLRGTALCDKILQGKAVPFVNNFFVFVIVKVNCISSISALSASVTLFILLS
jgi:hypothetical protein